MSTDGTTPTDPNAAVPEPSVVPEPVDLTKPADPTAEQPTQPATPFEASPPPQYGATPVTSEGTLANVEDTEQEPGFIARHTSMLIALMVAVIVAAVAIAGVLLYKDHVDDADNATEAAFTSSVAAQGATLETVECHGGTCAAVINGQAYTVLVQEDAAGKQHFGVSAYAGN